MNFQNHEVSTKSYLKGKGKLINQIQSRSLRSEKADLRCWIWSCKGSVENLCFSVKIWTLPAVVSSYQLFLNFVILKNYYKKVWILNISFRLNHSFSPCRLVDIPNFVPQRIYNVLCILQYRSLWLYGYSLILNQI